ncbi:MULTISPECIES: D-alanine--D-alanine ligase family protein [Dietzia]|uniref:D-alanine--D-alanine ligase n=1 Tax=Dietzia cercidiphylli TaxID=498199 RepID=A0ABP4U2V3_9ACTN|nr:D-alanine--D-alanine ligase family protein [Dietzia cercidiphylli]MBB1048977.1 D-alanine--D-alanine ligase [Dietzia cercidiphylli]MCT1513846.1 D-alanine--D-alanine ligase [Dietzia cercidiphylli]
MNRITVAVLYGGRSSEHSVSCVSAGAVMAHLDRSVYEVIPVGITGSGRWTLGPDDVSGLRIVDRVMPEVDPGRPQVALGLSTGDRGVLRYVDGERAGEQAARVDVVFPVMHGTHAEDGTVQGLLELSGIPYVGPGVFASAAGMDKEFTKVVLGAAGLPIGEQAVLRPGAETLPQAELDRLGLPLFVKPARGGSSIGITKVSRAGDLDAAIAEARRFDPKVIVEAAIVGREVECGVLQYPDGRVEASLPAELHIPGEPTGLEGETEGDSFYDFDTKYLDDVCTFDLPALLPTADTDRLRTLAVEAFHALDARGLSRVDFFVTEHGPVINEVNTMPGFTPISMYPQMWAASGVDYRTLLDTLVRTALAGC